MMEISEQDRAVFDDHYRESRIGRYLWGAAGFVLVAALGVIGYFSISVGDITALWSSSGGHDFSKVYTALDVKPLNHFIPQDVYDNLMKLEDEPCDKTAIYAAAEGMSKAGDNRWAADAYYGFGQRCGEQAEGNYRRAADLYVFIGDWQRGLIAANAAIKHGGAYDANVVWYKGLALSGLGRKEEAVANFDQVFQLHGSDSQTSAEVFFRDASTYASLGRFCEAQSLMERVLAVHPEQAKAKMFGADYGSKC